MNENDKALYDLMGNSDKRIILRILRSIMFYLSQYDCVTAEKTLEIIKSNEKGFTYYNESQTPNYKIGPTNNITAILNSYYDYAGYRKENADSIAEFGEMVVECSHQQMFKKMLSDEYIPFVENFPTKQ